MENKTNLADVDVTQVTLPELVRFIERMRKEFPVAIRVLAKRLFAQEYGIEQKELLESDMPLFDDEKVVQSLHHLEDDMQHQMAGTLILSLHDQFGFGKIRVMRLWGKAQEVMGSERMSAEKLAKWCEERDIDYDAAFGINSKKEARLVDIKRVLDEVSAGEQEVD